MKKLFNFKNIMFVLCVGIAIISTFFSCEVRAYSWDEFYDFENQLLVNNSVPDNLKTYVSYFKQNRQTTFNNYITNNNINLEAYRGISVVCFNGGSDTYYKIYLIKNNSSFMSYSNNLYSDKNYLISFDKWGSISSRDYDYTSLVGQTSGTTYEYFGLTDNFFGTYNNNMYFENYYDPIPEFDFTPYGFQLSGDSATYWNKFAYVSGFIPLGFLGDNTYYQLDIKLRDANGYDVANYSDVPGVGSISDDNSIMKVENTVVYVNAIYLSYYRNYNLLFKVWNNSNDFETFIYAYQFMPFSAVIENGNIVSSGDTTFSGADSTILITDNLNDYSNVDDILSGFLGFGGLFASGDNSFSGDVDFNVSGDLFTLLGYSDYDNSYKDFIYNGVYHNLKDVFLSSNDREFSFLFMGRNITINSNSFTTPNGVLKTFVSSFLVFGTIYYFYKTTIHFYHKMQEGNQLEAVETWSVDDESILM